MCIDQEHDDFNSQVLSKIGEKLYLKPKKADVYFTFDTSDERIPAHKLLLSSGSDVFEAMFYGSLKEKGDIRIVDTSAEAFKEFLQFFYFNKVELSIENVAEVIYLGMKYDVMDCLRLCTNWLTNNLTADNVICALGLAIIYDQKKLLKLCKSSFFTNAREILQSPNFLDCDRQVLSYILNMDRLSCTETEIFEVCMSWVRAASEKQDLTRELVQTHLGDSFYAIRFGSMSYDEFFKLLPKYGHLFSDAELSEILQIISQEIVEPKLFKKCRFPISSSWDERNIIKCNRLESISKCDYYDKAAEEITTFSTNAALLLGYIVLPPLFNRANDIAANIKCIQTTIVTSSGEVQLQFSFDYLFNGIINLPKPVTIKPGINYEIRFEIPSIESFYYHPMKPMATVSLEHDVVVQFGNDRNAGFIHKLGFNLLE